MSRKISEKWAVMECPICKKRGYYYLGDIPAPKGVDELEDAGFTKDDLSCYSCNKEKVRVSYEHWSAKDIVEIFGNEIEDRNHHWLTSMPNKVLNAMVKENVLMEVAANVLRNLMEDMMEN